MSATGTLMRFVPEGPEREELLVLVRLGTTFQAQHRGRRPGYLRRYLAGIVSTMPRPTFAALLVELKLLALRREIQGEAASPIESVNAEFELVTYHDPARGRQQVTFKTIRNNIGFHAKNVNPG